MAAFGSRFALSARQRGIIARRIIEAMREVGVLLLALTPLDYVMRDGEVFGAGVAYLLVGAATAFTVSLVLEVKTQR